MRRATLFTIFALVAFPAVGLGQALTDQQIVDQNAAVDADWYLSQYPDVRVAVEDGRIKSAEEHYRIYGFKEKRLPARPKFDEEFYLRANPDVAAAVRNGLFKSGLQHYVIYGYREGRKPLP